MFGIFFVYISRWSDYFFAPASSMSFDPSDGDGAPVRTGTRLVGLFVPAVVWRLRFSSLGLRLSAGPLP